MAFENSIKNYEPSSQRENAPNPVYISRDSYEAGFADYVGTAQTLCHFQALSESKFPSLGSCSNK